jgi:hypothetical protein
METILLIVGLNLLYIVLAAMASTAGIVLVGLPAARSVLKLHHRLKKEG